MSRNLNEVIYELAEELVDPAEAVLDDQVEETLDTEEDITCGVADYDDSIIEFIANGNRLTNEDPLDFTDDDISDIVFDEVEDDDDY